MSKLWFEWNKLSDIDDFELAVVDVSESGDWFLESPTLQQDIKSIYKMYVCFSDEYEPFLFFY